MNVRDIEIDKIDIMDNMRLVIKDTDIVQLMDDIKQHGLLEPIEVCNLTKEGRYTLVFGARRLTACKKLGWNTIPSEVIGYITRDEIINRHVSENIQRKDVNAFELGRILNSQVINDGYTMSELASKHSIPESRVRTAIGLYQKVPGEYANKVKIFKGGGVSKKGQVPSSTAKTILRIKRDENLSQLETKKLFDISRQDNMSELKLRNVGHFIKLGMTVDEAINNSNDYIIFRPSLAIEKNQYIRLGNNSRKVAGMVKEILKGNSRLKLKIL